MRVVALNLVIWAIGRSLGSHGRRSPLETIKSAEVSIVGDELATGFDRQCGEIAIRDEITSGVRCAAQPNKDLPVPGTGFHFDVVGSRFDLAHEAKG